MFSKTELDFIEKNLEGNPIELSLAYAKKSDLDYKRLIEQVACRKKAKTKLPELFENKDIVFPPLTNLEQTSSEITAKYKSELARGKSAADLTGGFGIDTIYLSDKFDNFTYVEPNSSLSDIVKENFKVLSLPIECENARAEDFLAKTSHLDFVYLDPSRKNESGKKVVFLEDYSPNVVEMEDVILDKADYALIKTSPLLDIKDTVSKLKNVIEIHIIAVNNDLKEVLYLLQNDRKTNDIIFTCVNFKKNNIVQKEVFTIQEIEYSFPTYSEPLKYLYEPNSAMMKSGGFNLFSHGYRINKLHNNSHLYTSDALRNDFAGRIFEIVKVHNYNKKELSIYEKANITTRNFPDSVEQIRKSTKIKDGGDAYLFATTDINDKLIIIACKKIES